MYYQIIRYLQKHRAVFDVIAIGVNTYCHNIAEKLAKNVVFLLKIFGGGVIWEKKEKKQMEVTSF
jgi:hypothetical protein